MSTCLLILKQMFKHFRHQKARRSLQNINTFIFHIYAVYFFRESQVNPVCSFSFCLFISDPTKQIFSLPNISHARFHITVIKSIMKKDFPTSANIKLVLRLYLMENNYFFSFINIFSITLRKSKNTDLVYIYIPRLHPST